LEKKREKKKKLKGENRQKGRRVHKGGVLITPSFLRNNIFVGKKNPTFFKRPKGRKNRHEGLKGLYIQMQEKCKPFVVENRLLG